MLMQLERTVAVDAVEKYGPVVGRATERIPDGPRKTLREMTTKEMDRALDLLDPPRPRGKKKAPKKRPAVGKAIALPPLDSTDCESYAASTIVALDFLTADAPRIRSLSGKLQ